MLHYDTALGEENRMTVIPHYIRKSVIQSIALILFGLAGVQCFVAFIGLSSDIGHGGFGLTQAVLYVLMTLPSELYQMFPMIGFIGCLVGLGRLSSTSELIVIRASGVSVGRIVLSVVFAAMMLIVFVTIIGGVIAPPLSEAADRIKTGVKDTGAYPTNVWLQQNNHFLHLGQITSESLAVDIDEFEFNQHNSVDRYIKGDTARRQADGTWVIDNATITTLNPDKAKRTQQSYVLPMLIRPSMLVDKKGDEAEESVQYLWKKVRYLTKVGLDPGRFTFALWHRVMQPFATIIMICLGVPFTLGSLRDASGSARMAVGILVGFGFYMLNEFLGPIALIYQIPAVLAASLPSLLFLAIFIVMLRRID